MRIEKSLLTGLGVRKDRAEKYLPALNTALAEHGIDTPLRVAHFLAQVLHESGKMKFVKENLNYSPKGLLSTFSKYFTTAQAAAYARKPEKIGSRVYANRMGNGPEASGEGYRYRGRGLIQLTGKSNYRKFSKWIGDDVVSNPERVATKYAVHSAVFYWMTRSYKGSPLNALADRDDVFLLTKAINGGTNGLDDRKDLLAKAKRLLNIAVVPSLLKRVTHRVDTAKLNFRRAPTTDAGIVTSLRRGAALEQMPDAAVEANGFRWIKVRFELNGQLREGFAAREFLRAA